MRKAAVIALLSVGCSSTEPASPASPAQTAPVISVASAPAAAPNPAASIPSNAVSQSTDEGPATLPPLETSDHWKAIWEGKCFAYSESLKQTACLDLKIFPRGHLKFVTLDLVMKDDQMKEVRRVQIHDQGRWGYGEMDLEETPLDPKKVASANTLLKDGGFVLGGKPAD